MDAIDRKPVVGPKDTNEDRPSPADRILFDADAMRMINDRPVIMPDACGAE